MLEEKNMKIATALAVLFISAAAFVSPALAHDDYKGDGHSDRGGHGDGYDHGNKKYKFDCYYLKQIATSSLLEIHLGYLAQTNSQNPAVQEFGRRLIEDHTLAYQQAQELASKLDCKLPDLNKEQRYVLKRLSSLRGLEFDREFIAFNIQAHIANIKLSQLAALKAKKAEVRQFARDQLLVLTKHLVIALEIRETLYDKSEDSQDNQDDQEQD